LKDTGLTLSYGVEVSNPVVDESPQNKVDTSSTKVSLYAMSGNLFAGYVRVTSGGTLTISSENDVVASDDTKLSDLSLQVTFGKYIYGKGGSLVGSGSDDPLTTFGTNVSFSSRATTGGAIIWTKDGSGDSTLAKIGTYTVKYKGKIGVDANKKDKTITQAFTVKNTMTVPTVTVATRTADTLNGDDIVKCLKTNVDMNNDTSDYASIVDLLKKTEAGSDKYITLAENNSKKTVGYAVVEDSYNTGAVDASGDAVYQTWYFYVPVNATFKTE
jgi:hypothetical protein